jgi:hypothetical protein
MKTTKSILTALLLFFPLTTFAMGGVSDGGGGTTNPDPVGAERVAESIEGYGLKLLNIWLNAKEYEFLISGSLPDRPESKLFLASPSVFEVIAKTKVEIRMSESCYDKNGQAWDGSIYASEPGAICLSAFTMGPKLNSHNVEAETLALYMHEISHLMGYTEEEAREIQSHALSAFSSVDAFKLALDVKSLGSNFEFKQLLEDLEYFSDPAHRFTPRAADRVAKNFADVNNQLFFDDQHFMLHGFRLEMGQKFSARFRQNDVLALQVCADDAEEEEGQREACRAELDKAFQGQDSATLAEILNRIDPQDEPSEADKALVVFRPKTPEILASQLKGIREFLLEMQVALQKQADAETKAYRR